MMHTFRVTGLTAGGARFFRDLRIEHQVTRVELNFIPAIRPGQPVQARIMHEAWNPQLQRFDIVPQLVVQTPAVVRLAAELGGTELHIVR